MRVGDDGRIAALRRGQATHRDDGRRNPRRRRPSFVAPGFVSSHSHLFGGCGLGVEETLYGWCDAMLGTTAHMTPGQMYWSTLRLARLLSNGVATACNFTDPLQAWESMVDGKRTGTAGIRGLEYHFRQAEGMTRASARGCRGHGRSRPATPGNGQPVRGRSRPHAHFRPSSSRRLVARSRCSGRAHPRPPSSSRGDAARREQRGHLLESLAVPRNGEIRALPSRRGARARADARAFPPDDAEIIDQAVEGGASMSWQPASNGRLVGRRSRRGLAMGMKVGVDLDDQACTDVATHGRTCGWASTCSGRVRRTRCR